MNYDHPFKCSKEEIYIWKLTDDHSIWLFSQNSLSHYKMSADILTPLQNHGKRFYTPSKSTLHWYPRLRMTTTLLALVTVWKWWSKSKLSLNHYKETSRYIFQHLLASFAPCDSIIIVYHKILSWVLSHYGYNKPMQNFKRQNEAEVPGYCLCNIDIWNQRLDVVHIWMVS